MTVVVTTEKSKCPPHNFRRVNAYRQKCRRCKAERPATR